MMKITGNVSDLVRRYFSAFAAQDRPVVEELLSDLFSFNSPLHARLGKADYFRRCWLNGENIATLHIEKLFERNDEAFVLYECTRQDGVRFRNLEYFRIEGHKIREVDVFFGREGTAGRGQVTDETQIRSLLTDRLKAVQARDVPGATAMVVPDVLLFDVINPLQCVGSDAAKKRAADWFATFRGPIGYELCDLSITTDSDVAFSHSLSRVTGTKTNGKEISLYWRGTTCYRKMNGRWMITHEHNSVPFDPESGRASLDLLPEPAAS